MRNKTVTCLFLKATAGLLTFALGLSVLWVCPADAGRVQAASGSAENANVEYIDISNYKDNTAPKPAKSEHKGWLFAGWFTDETCTEALNKSDASGECVAKFVPAEVLSVKCQIQRTTRDDSVSSSLRMISTVDSKYYRSVGFEVTVEEKTQDLNTNKVYKKIVSTVSDNTFTKTPDVFDTQSEYFVTYVLKNIPTTAFKTGIRIAPYWITLDGTKVYGVSRYARVEDGYLNIINVPVRLYSDEAVVAGYLEVGYTAGAYEYVSADIGTVFEEMEVACKDGKICCVGNLKKVSNNVKADGMYINLRFQVKDPSTFKNDETFPVSAEAFCNNEETVLNGFDVFDVVYQNMN